jgi:putative NADPH-quinone reductase
MLLPPLVRRELQLKTMRSGALVAEIEFSPLYSKRRWDNDPALASIQLAQEDIAWADHLVIVYPLGLG